MKLPKTTLEQWCALQAVADSGGFGPAAEALNKSQSSVSYVLARLQEQLPVPVLAQSGRRTVLTEAGITLLRRARALVDEALALERLAASLAQGWEPEVSLAVDVLFPPGALLRALRIFSENCRETRVRVIESVLSGTDEALFSRSVDLVLTPRVPPGFLGDPLVQVEFVAVAHPDHPLHRLGRAVTYRDLRAHRQLVIRDTGIKRQRDSGWLGSEQRWTVSHFHTSIDALRMGLGFAWIPRGHIEEELAEGTLKPLPMAAGGERYVHIYLIVPDGDGAGPAARELARVLRGECRGGHPMSSD